MYQNIKKNVRQSRASAIYNRHGSGGHTSTNTQRRKMKKQTQFQDHPRANQQPVSQNKPNPNQVGWGLPHRNLHEANSNLKKQTQSHEHPPQDVH